MTKYELLFSIASAVYFSIGTVGVVLVALLQGPEKTKVTELILIWLIWPILWVFELIKR